MKQTIYLLLIILILLVSESYSFQQAKKLGEIKTGEFCDYRLSFGLDYQIIEYTKKSVGLCDLSTYSGANINISNLNFAYLASTDICDAIQNAAVNGGEQIVLTQALIPLGEQFLSYYWNNQNKDKACNFNTQTPFQSIFVNGRTISVEKAKFWKPFLEAQGFSFNENLQAFTYLNGTDNDLKSRILGSFQFLYNKYSGQNISTINESNLLTALENSPGFGFHIKEAPAPLQKSTLRNDINSGNIHNNNGRVPGWTYSTTVRDDHYYNGKYSISSRHADGLHRPSQCYTAGYNYDCNCKVVCIRKVLWWCAEEETQCESCWKNEVWKVGNYQFNIKKTYNEQSFYKYSVYYQGYLSGTLQGSDQIEIKINNNQQHKILKQGDIRSGYVSYDRQNYYSDSNSVSFYINHKQANCSDRAILGTLQLYLELTHCSFNCQSCNEFFTCTSCGSGQNRENNSNCNCQSGYYSDLNSNVCKQQNDCNNKYEGPFYNFYLSGSISSTMHDTFDAAKNECNGNRNCKGISYFKNGSNYKYQIRTERKMIGQINDINDQYNNGQQVSWLRIFDENCCSISPNSSEKCSDCSSGTCICDKGFYMNQNNFGCLACSDACKNDCTGSEYNCCSYKCDSCQGEPSNCLVCSDVNRVYAPQCDCKNGYYDEDGKDNKICQQCVFPCKNCTSKNDCLTCVGSNRLQSQNCICPDRLFDDGTSENCQQCIHPCVNCTNQNTCLTCVTRNNSKPAPSCECQDGYYEDSSKLCQKCPAKCSKCSDPNTCTECAGGLGRLDLSSNCGCSDGHFEQPGDIQDCGVCQYPCANCENSSINCLSCFSAQNRKNVPDCNCNEGYFKDGNSLCQQCSYPCQECTNSKLNCTICVSDINRNGSTPSCSCDSHFFDNGSSCQECSHKCKECENTADNCTECPVSSFRTALPSCDCDTGYFEEGVPTCIQCRYNCKSCSNATSCDECYESSNRISAPDCECKVAFFDTPNVGVCGACSSSCDPDCITSSNNCCSYKCYSCKTDVNNCEQCSHATRENAPTCDCKDTYFDDGLNNKECQSCIHPCENCTSLSVCTSCRGTNRNNNSQCNCPDTTYDDGSTPDCQTCQFPCINCTDTTTCLTCVVRDNINSAPQCTCLDGFYEDSSRICQPCPKKCSKCSDQNTCTECVSATGRSQDLGTNCGCSDNFYDKNDDSLECYPCQYPCLNCVNQAIECIDCIDSINRESPSDCNCLDKFYRDLSNDTCQACKYPCVNCTNPTVCLSCVSDVNRNGPTPDCSCDSGYFDNGTNCQKCSHKCQECISNENKCTKCPLNSFRSLTPGCDCDIGYFENGVPICGQCLYNCKSCTNSSECTECFENSFRVSTPDCQCKEGYYDINDVGICGQCSSTCTPNCIISESNCCSHKCYSCENQIDECTQCSHATRENLPDCLCKDTFYDDGKNHECQSCKYPCLNCTSDTICLTCLGSNRIQAQNCICPDGLFDDGSSANCQTCDFPCQNCENNSSNCTLCVVRDHINAAPNCHCKDGYYEDSNQLCQKCPARCSKCSDENTCTECATGTGRTLNLGSDCGCIEKYFQIDSDNNCHQCAYPCYNCKNSDSNCLDCVDRSLSSNTRQDSPSCQCKDTFYNDGSNEECGSCIHPCKNCTDLLTCSTCRGSNRLQAQNCICPDKFFDDGLTEDCLACTFPCDNCKGDTNTCTSCVARDHINSIPNCHCKDGYYQDSGDKSCKKCSLKCKTCSDFDTCIQCATAVGREDIGSNCVCSENYFGNKEDVLDCYQCDYPCFNCTGTSSNCSDCVDKDLSSNTRHDAPSCGCKDTYYDNSSDECHKCIFPCLNCTSALTCLSCVGDNRVLANNCECKKNHHDSGDTDDCFQCQHPCLSCTDNTTCITCIARENNHPAPSCKCLDGYYENSDLDCIKCPLRCSKCSDANTCTECSSGTGRTGNIANNCDCQPEYFDKPGDYQECFECEYPCINCVNASTECIDCVDKNLSSNTREDPSSCECKDTYYNDGSVECPSCVYPCLNCTSQTECLTCLGSNRNNNKQCDCPLTTFDDGSSHDCQACVFPCVNCFDTTTCQLCELRDNINAAPDCHCKDGYYEDSSQICQECPKKCSKCSDENTCTECAVGTGRNGDVSTNCGCMSEYFDMNNNSLQCYECQYPCVNCVTSALNCIDCVDRGLSSNTREDAPNCGCKDTYYNKGEEKVCPKCKYPCLNCTSDTDCLTCLGSNRIQAQNCICPDGLFDDGSSDDCQSCDFPCQNCANSSTNCTLCVVRDHINPAPNCHCQDGYYEDSNQKCQKCNEKCSKCSDFDVCTECAVGNGRNGDINTNCGCQDQFYDKNDNSLNCYPCAFPCHNCITTDTNCLDCVDKDLVSNTRKNAPDCYCKDTYYNKATDQECHSCQYPCLNCISKIICETCLGTNRLQAQNCICPDKLFDDGSSHDCQACIFPCVNCVNSKNNCTSCVARDHINAAPNCHCKDGYYEDTNKLCQKCPGRCSKCSDENTCTECASGAGRTLDSSTNCGCEEQYFDNNDYTENNCFKCVYPCFTCVNQETECVLCIDKDLTSNTREDPTDCNCKDTYYNKNDEPECPSCQYPCKNCLSDSQCLTCLGTNRVQAKNCICPAKFFDDGSSDNCQACVFPCINCVNSETNCTSCVDRDHINSAPNCHCKDGYYEDSSQQCQKCPGRCSKCSDKNTCTECAAGAGRTLNVSSNCGCQEQYFDNKNYDENNCFKCAYPCFNCINSQDECLNCVDKDLVSNTRENVPDCSCKDTYYNKNTEKECPKCKYPCLNCTSDTDCLTCLGTNRIEAQNCICPDNFFDDGSSDDCQPCKFPCVNCVEKEEKCTSCVARANANPTPNCHCKDGYYENSLKECIKCPGRCSKCSDEKTCTECALGEGRNGNLSTNCACTENYFDKNIYNLVDCYQCQYPCFNCQNTESECTDCVDRGLTSNTRENAPDCGCKDTYYNDGTEKQCSSCVHPCLHCTSLNTCTLCLGSNRLQAQNCICPDQLFDDGKTHDCQPCVFPCVNCENSQSHCLTCVSRENINPAPDCTCLDGYYQDSSQECQKCPSRCSKCDVVNTCTECALGQGRNMQLSSDCACSDNYFDTNLNELDCQPCIYPCINCVNKNNECTTCVAGDHRNPTPDCNCQTGFYEDNKKNCKQCQYPCVTCTSVDVCLTCVSDINRNGPAPDCECDSGYFDNGTNCQKCSYKCKECVNSPENCTECPDTSFRTQLPNCDCDTGYFDQNKPICGLCSFRCESCVDNADNCTSCFPDSFRIGTPHCECTLKYYEISDQSICDKCSDKCGNYCIGGPHHCCSHKCYSCKYDITNCLECAHETRENAPACTCKDTFYDNGTSGECQACIHPCLNCVSPTQCTACRGNNRNNNQKCDCPDTFYDDGSTPDCLVCEFPCVNCTDPTTCLTCVVRDFSNPAPSCTCQDGYYEDENQKCQKCAEKCSKCYDFDVCTECKSGTGRNQNLLDNCGCLDGYFDTNLNELECKLCVYPCETCINSETTCVNCVDQIFREEAPDCNCLPGYFKNSLNKCQACLYPCVNCVDSELNCATCVTDVNRNTPAPSCACDSGYFDSGSNCQQCSHKCQECVNNENNCTQCAINGNRNSLPDCECNHGYFEDGTSICKQCSFRCETCLSNTDNCTMCHQNSFRDPKPTCKCIQGYYEIPNQPICEQCSYTCESCKISQNNCSVCSHPTRINPPSCGCDIGLFNHLNNPECKECIYKCYTCETNPDNCLICSSQTRENAPACDCKDTYFDNGKEQEECEQCVHPCVNCTALEICTSCVNGSNRLNVPQCACADGYYDDGITADCIICKHPCVNCLSYTECLSCLIRDNSNPAPDCSCQDGYYEDPDTLECLKCADKCVTCSLFDQCIVCNTGIGRSGGNTPECGCDTGYFDTNNNEVDCDKCDYYCENCKNTSDNCTECYENKITRQNEPQCLCMDGFFDDYQNSQNRGCLDCIFPCLTCFDSVVCKSCQGNHRVLPYCLCKKGFFEEKKQCFQCDVRCSVCNTNPTNCEKCRPGIGRLMQAPECACEDGYYQFENKINCRRCLSECKTCENGFNCLTCSNPELKPPYCVNVGFYTVYTEEQDSENRIVNQSLVKCSPQCLKCTSYSGECTQCQGVNRSNTLPDCSCLEGYHDNINSQKDCEKCKEPCKTCLNNHYCMSCQDIQNMYLNEFDGSCNCVEQFKYDQTTKKCEKCYNYKNECLFECPYSTSKNEKTQECDEQELVLTQYFTPFLRYVILALTIALNFYILAYSYKKVKKMLNSWKLSTQKNFLRDQYSLGNESEIKRHPDLSQQESGLVMLEKHEENVCNAQGLGFEEIIQDFEQRQVVLVNDQQESSSNSSSIQVQEKVSQENQQQQQEQNQEQHQNNNKNDNDDEEEEEEAWENFDDDEDNEQENEKQEQKNNSDIFEQMKSMRKNVTEESQQDNENSEEYEFGEESCEEEEEEQDKEEQENHSQQNQISEENTINKEQEELVIGAEENQERKKNYGFINGVPSKSGLLKDKLSQRDYVHRQDRKNLKK